MLEAVSQLLKYTTLKKGHSKSIIGYIVGAKKAATALMLHTKWLVIHLWLQLR